MRRAGILVVAAATVLAAILVVSGALTPDPRALGTRVPAGAPLPITVEPDPGDPPEVDLDAPSVALAPPGGAIVQQGVVRLPKPTIDPNEPRRVGIQIGHWQTNEVPREYGTRILAQTGTSWAGYTEVAVTSEIADRVAALLSAQGIRVDILPTTIPEGYLADAFVSLHADGDGVGQQSGFKMAHGSRRGSFEDALLSAIRSTYAEVTGLGYDAEHISRNMTGYFAFNWSRYQHATSPFTPAVILEMAYLSNDDDRSLLVDRPDRVAAAIANGIFKFLDETPRTEIFGQDLLIPTAPLRQRPPPSPSPRAP